MVENAAASAVAPSSFILEGTVRQFEILRSQLDRIAAGEQSEELIQIYNIYVRPYGVCPVDDEQLDEVLDKLELALPLSQQEQELYERYIRWQEEQASGRLPSKGRNAFRLSPFARRHTRLTELGAPAMVIENNARCLAEELVLYHWLQRNPSEKQEEV